MPKELKGSRGLFDFTSKNEDIEAVENKDINSKQNIEQEQNLKSEQKQDFNFKTKDKRKSKTFYLKSETIDLIQSLSKKYSKLNKMKISESDIVEELISIGLKVIDRE